ncbi:hypothetical protein NCCP2222_02070 [Sporosarcina sp. NCCP-2222]|uniref:hypothetical protein n=1 Tax=Sporosarcina sp. NCCP-2222 TaxID=2935073 RepID=UPI0020843685|nr:hypothetical protein [Sporosarcina sp. NCCP-2222]GKV54260.1 hypothetical protein NCCP2222_02070 [Sporosarcina sp. NCCP-2222]
MKARIKKVSEVGSCSYCDISELKPNGMGLDYPYDEVIEISGRQVVSRLCFECAGKLAKVQQTYK